MNTTATVAAERLIRTLYRLADEGSTESALDLFAEDADIRFGNNPVGTGVATLLSATEKLAAAYTSIQHTVTDLFVDAAGRKGSSELAMTYVRHDGSEFNVPATNVFDFNEQGQISKYHVYVDLTGLLTS